MPSSRDKDLDILLATLVRIQADVGGPETENGGGKKKKKGDKEDKFLAIKSRMMTLLSSTCDLMDKAAKPEGGRFASADPKQMIQRNQQVRGNIRELEKMWGEMDALFAKERGKRRSRMTKEESDARRQLLVDLKGEIAELKSIHQQGMVGGQSSSVAGGAAGGYSVQSRGEFMQANPMSQGVSADTQSAALTDEQHYRIQQIKQRGQEMDEKYLTQIEAHVDKLTDVAKAINEELQVQDRMVDDLGRRIDDANEHVSNVNTRMKDTLKQVRGADKFCIDVMCILMLVGMIAVLYAVIQGNG
ncbi:unnamed protein product [Chrysoparadoxa australica]